jgi:hypothetical protein
METCRRHRRGRKYRSNPKYQVNGRDHPAGELRVDKFPEYVQLKQTSSGLRDRTLFPHHDGVIHGTHPSMAGSWLFLQPNYLGMSGDLQDAGRQRRSTMATHHASRLVSGDAEHRDWNRQFRTRCTIIDTQAAIDQSPRSPRSAPVTGVARAWANSIVQAVSSRCAAASLPHTDYGVD